MVKKQEVIVEDVDSKVRIDAELLKDFVSADEINETRELYDKNRYGEPQDNKTFQYSLHEACYLLERGKFRILDGKKELKFKDFVKKAIKAEPGFWTRYCVYKDLRKRGYIVKTALKFGADFRVYDRGIKPGDDHAKWIVYPVSEREVFSWHEFSAKNRVAHSTKKSLLIGIVDSENEVTYYNINWLRP
jgi:tRNA-intron endonuclease